MLGSTTQKLTAVASTPLRHQIKKSTTKEATGMAFSRDITGASTSSIRGKRPLAVASSRPSASPAANPAPIRSREVPTVSQKLPLRARSPRTRTVSSGPTSRMRLSTSQAASCHTSIQAAAMITLLLYSPIILFINLFPGLFFRSISIWQWVPIYSGQGT